jgi:SET domain-containing protein
MPSFKSAAATGSIDIMSPQKKALLAHLRSDVFCRLGVSKTHGVGVFAIRDIPKGVNPLKIFKRRKESKLSLKHLKGLPKNVSKQIDKFCYIKKGYVFVPTCGMNTVDMSIFLNHSKKPNLRFKKSGALQSLKKIRTGEELTIDYDLSFGEKHQF